MLVGIHLQLPLPLIGVARSSNREPFYLDLYFWHNYLMLTWIKFCGTTSLADAMASIAAGADAVGFIFAPSKRQVNASQVKTITQELPVEIEKIGVFMDERVENILSIVESAGLTGVQLHGRESSDDVARLAEQLRGEQRSRNQRFRVIKTVLVKDNFPEELQTMHAVRPPDCILLDAGAGSGKTFAWDAARELVHSSKAQLIVAGGLTPENVGDAVAMLSPWGVDVVSGVELQAGKKDPQKLNAFVDSVRKAENK
jgi:phosphoribosylanthranilate isomerase